MESNFHVKRSQDRLKSKITKIPNPKDNSKQNVLYQMANRKTKARTY